MRVEISSNPLFQRGLAWFNGLTKREKLILWIPVILVVFFTSYAIYIPIHQAFLDQSEEIEQITKDLVTVPKLLERYARLKARTDQIENEYREVEIKEGELSLLEKIIRDKVGGNSGFDIKNRPVASFGGNYEQAPFTVKFFTNSISNLVDFLSEVVSGQKRMLLTRLDVDKSRGGERLEVEVDVSSIRKIK